MDQDTDGKSDMSYDNSIVLIVEAAARADAEALGLQLGHSGAEYSVPLSAEGLAPATHFGLHSWGRDDFVAVMAGEAPEGVDASLFETVRAALILSVRTSAAGHFADVLAQHELQRVAL